MWCSLVRWVVQLSDQALTPWTISNNKNNIQCFENKEAITRFNVIKSPAAGCLDVKAALQPTNPPAPADCPVVCALQPVVEALLLDVGRNPGCNLIVGQQPVLDGLHLVHSSGSKV